MDETYVITDKGIIKKQDAIHGYIREISTKEALEELIERMPYIQTIQAQNAKGRKELYKLAMNEYDDVEWVKVIKSAYLRMEERRYEDFEPKYAGQAKNFLYREIAIRYDIPFEEVEAYLNKTIAEQMAGF